MRSRFSGVCASFIVAIVSLPVFAQQDGSFWMDADRASVNIGGFAADFKTDLRLSSDELGIGTKISLEDDLGMDSDRVLARIDGYYRFSRRHRIDYGLLDIERHGSTRVQRDLNVGDLVIPVNVLCGKRLQDDGAQGCLYLFIFPEPDRGLGRIGGDDRTLCRR